MHNLNDLELRISDIKRRIAEVKEQIGYTSGNATLDPQIVKSKNTNHSLSNRNTLSQETYNSPHANELDNLRNQLRKQT